MSESLRDRLQSDVLPAMKARDALSVSVLRTTLAAIANAEAVDATDVPAAVGLGANEVARRHLDETEVRSIVVAVRDELIDAVDEMVAVGREDLARDRRQQADALDRYLDG